MKAVLLIGLQASGKSAFYNRFFRNTHIRINLDMLKTRNREARLLEFCLETRQPLVVDNTNPAVDDRARYIPGLKAAGFYITGYYFSSCLELCQQRNRLRSPDQIVPEGGLLHTYRKLQLPDFSEGFSELYYVTINPDNGFDIQNWKEET